MDHSLMNMEIFPHEIPHYEAVGYSNGTVVEAQYSKKGGSMQLIRKPVGILCPHVHENFNFGPGVNTGSIIIATLRGF